MSDAANAPSAVRLHAGFLKLLPRIESHARIHFRHVRCPGRRDDLVAEAVACAWKWYVRAVAVGKDPADFPAAFAFKAACHARAGRRLCRSDSARDALSPVAQCRHNFVTQTLPEFESGVEGNEVIDALRDNTVTPPADQAAFRIDFPGWLSRLPERKRRIVQSMALGLGTGELASRHKVSPARVSQLRRELHADWRRFHGEPVAC